MAKPLETATNAEAAAALLAPYVVDSASIPENLGSPSPGVSDLAAAADHVHKVPSQGELGIFPPLWEVATNGQRTLPRGMVGGSDSYTQTPAAGVEHLTYFIAERTRVVGNIRFQVAGVGSTGITLARLGLYSVHATTGALTLVGSTASVTGWGGAWAQNNRALTAPYELVGGVLYAVGNLQVGTTPASLIGAWDVITQARPRHAATIAGQADLPSTIADSALAEHQFPISYFLA